MVLIICLNNPFIEEHGVCDEASGNGMMSKCRAECNVGPIYHGYSLVDNAGTCNL